MKKNPLDKNKKSASPRNRKKKQARVNKMFLALACILFVALDLGVGLFFYFNAAEKKSDGLILTKNKENDGYVVTGISEIKKEYVVPSVYKGLPVTAIGNSAFYKLDRLQSVCIPDSVTTIESYAFYACGKLSELSLPSSLTIVEDSAFKGCESLRAIAYGGSFEDWENIYLGQRNDALFCASVDCAKQSEPHEAEGLYYRRVNHSYCLVTGVSEIQENYSVLSVYKELPVTTIGVEAFGGLTELAAIEIPNTIKTVASRAFYGCENLQTIAYDGDYAAWEKIIIESGNEPFTRANVNFAREEQVAGSQGLTYRLIDRSYCAVEGLGTCTEETVTIPSTYQGREVLEIAPRAFANAVSFKSIVIPASVRKIGANAFFDERSALRKVDYLGGVEGWCDIAFFDASANPLCSNDFVELYLDGERVEELTIPSSVKKIGEYAFARCQSLKKLTIAEGVEEIGRNAFFKNKVLTGVVIPKSVRVIGPLAFCRCAADFCLTVEKNNPFFTAEDNVLFNKEKTVILYYAHGKKDSRYAVPESVYKISDYAFFDCADLEEIVIPDSVAVVGSYAFAGCSRLSSFVVPSSVKSIGYAAFEGALALKDVYYQGSRIEWELVTAKAAGFNESVKIHFEEKGGRS